MSEDLFASHVVYTDRSTAERYARCPMQARLEAEHPVAVGYPANIGNEGHDTISRTVGSYVDSGGNMTRYEIAEELRKNLRESRGDVQPAVIEAFKGIVYDFADMLVKLQPDAILRWDGGPGDRTGQLAAAFENGLGITSELDFLHATSSREVLREYDWKSGWGLYDIDSVYESFQFRTHAVLAFAQYPDANVLEVGVWNTRKSRLPLVTFERKYLPDYRSHVLGALSTQAQYENAAIEAVPAWPSAEKCRICPVARHCPAADPDLKADPLVLLESFCAVEAKRDAIHKLLRSHVQKTKTDLVAPNGMRFGTEKPVKRRVSYQTYTDTPDQESEAE